MGLLQPDAAQVIGVCKASIWQWENGRAEPEDRYYPSIIAFLGREPWPEPQTLAERLRAERRRRGMTARDAARAMGVAHGSVSSWESGATAPGKRDRKQVSDFLARPI